MRANGSTAQAARDKKRHYLEERGDPRGEFIRTQCELATLPDRCEKKRRRSRYGWKECFWRVHTPGVVVWNPPPGVSSGPYPKERRDDLHPSLFDRDPCRRCRLLKLQNDLFHADQNIVPLGNSLRRLIENRLCRVAVLRGFVSEATIGWQMWRDHADTILAEHPVRAVRFTTLPCGDSVVYFMGDMYRASARDDVRDLFKRLKTQEELGPASSVPWEPSTTRRLIFQILKCHCPRVRVWKFPRRNPYADLPTAATRRTPITDALVSMAVGRRASDIPYIIRDTGQLRRSL